MEQRRAAVLATVIDISERKEAEEHQKFLIKELQHRSQNLFAVIQAIGTRSLGEGRTPEETQAILAGRLQALLRDEGARVRFFAAEALGRIGDASAAGPIIAMLEANDDVDPHLRHAGALALSRIGDAERVRKWLETSMPSVQPQPSTVATPRVTS